MEIMTNTTEKQRVALTAMRIQSILMYSDISRTMTTARALKLVARLIELRPNSNDEIADHETIEAELDFILADTQEEHK